MGCLIQAETLYPTLIGELWDVYWENFGEILPIQDKILTALILSKSWD